MFNTNDYHKSDCSPTTSRNNKIIVENPVISTKRLSRIIIILVIMIIVRAISRVEARGAFVEKWHEKCVATRNEPLSLGKMLIVHKVHVINVLTAH